MGRSARSLGWLLGIGVMGSAVGCTGGGEVTSQTTLGAHVTTGSSSGSSGTHASGTAAGAGAGSTGTPGSTGTTGSPTAGTTGSGATTGQPGTTGTVATGTTTGGTCPANLPDIATGVTQDPKPCTNGELGSTCPSGFSCVSNKCLLNGANSGVQVTLSFDDVQDLDLHVIEPSGCEIYWGHPGPVEYPDGGVASQTGHNSCSATGWLDRDSNAGCNPAHIDGVNIENIFYPTGAPAPSGTYRVKLDYWAACTTNKPSSNYAIQVRANGVTNVYCGTANKSDADHGGASSGDEITSFVIP